MRKKSRQISNLRWPEPRRATFLIPAKIVHHATAKKSPGGVLGATSRKTPTPTQREARQRAKRAIVTPPPAERGDARESSARAGEPTGRQTQSSRAVGLNARDARRGWHLHAQRSWGGWEGACQNKRGCIALAPSSSQNSSMRQRQPRNQGSSMRRRQPPSALLYTSAPTAHPKLIYASAQTTITAPLHVGANLTPKTPLCIGANFNRCA